MASMSDLITSAYCQFDNYVVDVLSARAFTANLITTRVSRIISEGLFVSFVLLFSYELIYWSGIYLGLWEYHAKDIFTEVPVHCAHIYVRINIIDEKDVSKLRAYYGLKQSSSFNVFNWKKLNLLAQDIFKLKKFVKYHFEFSPDDFEKNPQPEWGSTVEHLRLKILSLVDSSSFYNDFVKGKKLSKENVLVFNNKNEEVTKDHDQQYLSKVFIETGNVIDCTIAV